MKKIIFVFLSFLMFIPSVLAEGKISGIDVNVLIDENGEATITEKWQIEKQDITYIEKSFSDVKDVTISDISVTSNRDIEIKAVDNWDKKKKNTYYFNDSNDKKKIFIAIDGENDTYTITYKVKGMIVEFSDVQGIEWCFIPRSSNQRIELFTTHVTSKNHKFEAANTALYVIGGNNLEASFVDGAIYLYAKEVKSNYPIKLMTSFNGIEFTDTIKKDKTFEERYKSEVNSSNVTAEILNLVTSKLAIVIFVILGVIIVIIIIKVISNSLKKHDEYYGIQAVDKEIYNKIENADYYDAAPCNGDLYKIAFIAGYFKLLKNRSDLIGAILLKWDFENYIEIVGTKENPHIKIKPGQYFEHTLDYDLYNVLIAASTQGYLAGSRLNRYAQEHYLRVMTWFNMGHHDTINNELARGNIQRVKKLKKYELVLQENIMEDAIRLAGLKKYLLHFNQVPRKTELTTEGYKYLLILAELLGIGEQVSKEILRKNPDNGMAKKLADLQVVKHIYKGVYSTALAPYKQVVKNNNKTSYDPEIEQIITKDDDATKNRRF